MHRFKRFNRNGLQILLTTWVCSSLFCLLYLSRYRYIYIYIFYLLFIERFFIYYLLHVIPTAYVISKQSWLKIGYPQAPQAANTISWTIITLPRIERPSNRVYQPAFQITQIPHGWLALVWFIKYAMIYRLIRFVFFLSATESFLFSARWSGGEVLVVPIWT